MYIVALLDSVDTQDSARVRRLILLQECSRNEKVSVRHHTHSLVIILLVFLDVTLGVTVIVCCRESRLTAMGKGDIAGKFTMQLQCTSQFFYASLNHVN